MSAKRDGLVSVTLPLEMMYRYIFDVGAVGQPRDNDARASYGIYHKDKFVIRRVPYDFKATQKKIMATKVLASAFAYRLEHGR
jgi:diadenosine tetraphosphatase ApaH/serine/threonine PP2A family protein phosphatase